MKKTAAALAIVITFFACVALAAENAAQKPVPLEVTADDLVAAGWSGVKAVDPLPTRFRPPVRYFRVAESLNDSAAKKDCDDCRDLVAVYAAESPDIPGWSINQREPLRMIGGRTQARLYLKDKKRIIIVTGPDQKRTMDLADRLKAKFSK